MALKRIIFSPFLKTNFQSVLFSRAMCEKSESKPKSKSPNPVGCKVAVITGGSIGIGYSCAEAILKNGGKAVMLGDIREKEGKEAVCKLVKECGENKVCFLKTDVTKKEELENLFESAKEKFKNIDIVINNAGLLQDKKWSLEIDVNVKGVIAGTLLGFKHMGKNNGGKGGVIVNMASIYGLQQAHGCPVYNGTKHFVIGFSRAMSHEYYEKLTGVKVLTMCPGVTVTNMIDESADYGLEGFGDVGKILKDGLADLPSQPVEACGECLMKMLKDGRNGGIWVIEESECYRVKLPNRKTLRDCD